jgi:hypothetical protein
VRDSARRGLTFGIYPGSALGDIELAGPPDIYTDQGDTVHAPARHTPAGYDRYAGRVRTLDLVAAYHSRSGDVAGYCAFIERLIERHAEHLATLQVGEEPNVTDDPNLDGAYPRVAEALIAGVHAAKEQARRSGHPDLSVGCNSTPLFGPAAAFFADLARAGGERFIGELDYIGLDFFPDVFRPIAPGRLDAAVQGVLEAHRGDILAPAGLGHLPIVITEHGWPTGPGRPAARQAEVVRAVIEVIARNAEALNITGYIHHALRRPFRRFRALLPVRADDRRLRRQTGLRCLPGADQRALAVTGPGAPDSAFRDRRAGKPGVQSHSSVGKGQEDESVNRECRRREQS